MKNLNIDKKIIGVIGRTTLNTEGVDLISIDNNIRRAILKKGCIPFMIMPLKDIDYKNTPGKEIPPITIEEEKYLKAQLDICDGLILQGGNRWYNYDDFIYRYALEKDLPMLGICMGMQTMSANDNNRNTAQKNETDIEHSKINEKYVHKVTIQEGTLLSKIISEKEIMVNSNHKYHITDTNKYKVSAISEDGLIEAIELNQKRFCLGIQWHPEKMLDYDKHANEIFDYFISKL